MAIQSKSRARQEPPVTVSFSDSIALVKEQVQWTPKGVCLLTKWPFRVGAEVEFAFDHKGERHGCTGVVVACQPLRDREDYYEVALYFVETPGSKLQKAACACKLAKDGHIPPEEEQMITTEEGASRLEPKGRSGVKGA